MCYGWEGEKVRLVPLDREKHFNNCVRWLNDPKVTEWTLIGDYPITRVSEGAFFDRMSVESDSDVVFAIETREENEEHVGIIGITGINHRHGVGTPGLFIGRKSLWQMGLGTDAFRVLSRYAFEVMGLRMLLSEAMSDNQASVRMHEKCGYREIGCIPGRYWKRGAYRDSVQFILRRDDWKA